jgi:hypothetical protein
MYSFACVVSCCEEVKVGLGPFEFTIGLIFSSHPKWRRAVFQHDTIKPFDGET